MTSRRRKAQYIATLVYVDEPQLILLQSSKSKVIAVAIDRDEMAHPFLASVISEEDWQRYARGIVDLRYLFLYAAVGYLYVFDLGKMSGAEVSMQRYSQAVSEDILPSRQFFSRDHTESLPLDLQAVGVQAFAIDGAWDLPDFAQFYDKFSDIYAFSLAVMKYAASNTLQATRDRISDAFHNHPFKGGSSYLHFYKDLYKIQNFGDRLSVKSMQYASPGHVDVRGREDVFSRAHQAIVNFEVRSAEIRKAYGDLYGHLRSLRYLSASPRDFDNSSPTAAIILEESRNLAQILNMDNTDLILELSNGNALVFSKIVMSYARRVKSAFMFFAEGRVQFR